VRYGRPDLTRWKAQALEPPFRSSRHSPLFNTSGFAGVSDGLSIVPIAVDGPAHQSVKICLWQVNRR
jgi:hypothetical protein